jgi:hypothetical protein
MGAWGRPAYWFCIGSNNPYQALGVPPNHVRPRLTELARVVYGCAVVQE